MTYTFWLGAEGDVEVDTSYERYAVSAQFWRDFNYKLLMPATIQLHAPFPGAIQLGDIIDYGDGKTGRVIFMARP